MAEQELHANLPPPPRHVPWLLRLALLTRGGLALAGWLVFGLGGAMALVFGSFAEPWDDPFEGAAQATARVVATETMNLRVNSRRVHAVRFEWQADGATQRGTSYLEGTPPAVGATLAVRWLPGPPSRARAVGMRSAPLPRWARLTLAIPLVGLGLLVGATVRSLRHVRLLCVGLPARGVCTAKRRTASKVNGRPVQILTFRYVDARGSARTTEVRTHRVDPLLDDAEELLLYDPADGRALLWDALPLRPLLDGSAGFAPPTTAELAAGLIAPTIAAVAWAIGQAIVGGG